MSRKTTPPSKREQLAEALKPLVDRGASKSELYKLCVIAWKVTQPDAGLLFNEIEEIIASLYPNDRTITEPTLKDLIRRAAYTSAVDRLCSRFEISLDEFYRILDEEMP